MEFYFISEEHEKSLQKLSYKTSEAHVASIVSHHLLSQLLPYPSNYFVDSYYTNGKSEVYCPCGCGEPINFGSTLTGELYKVYIHVYVHACVIHA